MSSLWMMTSGNVRICMCIYIYTSIRYMVLFDDLILSRDMIKESVFIELILILIFNRMFGVIIIVSFYSTLRVYRYKRRYDAAITVNAQIAKQTNFVCTRFTLQNTVSIINFLPRSRRQVKSFICKKFSFKIKFFVYNYCRI